MSAGDDLESGSSRPIRERTVPSQLAQAAEASTGQHQKGPPSHVNGFHIDPPSLAEATEIALATLSTIPTPLLVLSSLQTIILANSAVGRLLGVDQDGTNTTVTEILRGQTLSQIGIDLVSDGVPIWVSWDKFLDNLALGLQKAKGDKPSLGELLPGLQGGETTPTGSPNPTRGRSPNRSRTRKSQDTVVDVVISSRNNISASRSRPHRQTKARGTGGGTACRMIISIWTLDNQRFFTLTFTSPPRHASHRPYATPNQRDLSTSTNSSKSSQSQGTPSSLPTSQIGSASEKSSNGAFFPPTSASAQCASSSTFSNFQKVLKMKDAMLSAIDVPLIAMWRDESVVFPNLAARRLLAVDTDPTSDDSYDFASRFKPWSADFARELEESANPIVALCRTQRPFSSWQIGLINEKTGRKSTFDVSGHPVCDEKSGEFLAGIITFKDVTSYTEKIAFQTTEKEEQFRQLCDVMPIMCWSTRSDGELDYVSQRWFDYTGLRPASLLGNGWKQLFHDEDLPEADRCWAQSLASGEEYKVQYRCRRYDGEWRWMLGRALPLRHNQTGEILKWFGSLTDIQDVVDARAAGQRARQNLMDVLKHSQMSLWIIDRDENVTFLEGGYFSDDFESGKEHLIGKPIYDLLANHIDPASIQAFRKAVKRTLHGTSDLEICENEIGSRWFRSKMVPLKGKKGPNGMEDDDSITGVIGIGTEVTQMREKEQENIKLLANETAAKEASKMKSNFLANMSHEIRTPIAGVLGMSELLMDTRLDDEQSEFAQNIQRSANSLLTVINDILDFSKIESGRLDIEEVQFSLGVVLQDVAKMLSFAAQRKGLEFLSQIRLGASEDLILLGDPGRIRQILTNLLTNSIKFTTDGYVRMSTAIISETSDTSTVEFCVEDSGIGIEEEVKKRLFRPFSQADSSTARRFGGTGLGLTISKNLVELMHGTIRLDSKLDAGTKATFTIPFKKVEYRPGSSEPLADLSMIPDRLQSELSLSLTGSSNNDNRRPSRLSPPSVKSSTPKGPALLSPHRSMASSESVSQIPLPDTERKKIHILVVEDNPVNQQIALKFIKALKFSVSGVWNGKEALEYLLKATSPDLTPEQSKAYPIPSLILMDVQMPILDGYHATHMLRYHAPFTAISALNSIPVVAMTASAIHGDREKCEKAGMDDYMAKPVKRSLLESTILRWVTTGRNTASTHRPTEDNAGLIGPLYTKQGTDESSTCTDHDAIVRELFQRPRLDEVTAGVDPPKLVRPPRQTALARRSSISRTILETAIPGLETEGDRALRRAQAEDKARTLRDAKLMSATNNDRSPRPPMPNGLSDATTHSDPSTSRSPKNYSHQPEDEVASPMLLTEENMSRFNFAQDGYPAHDESSSPPMGSAHFSYPVTEMPGPPPEGLLAAVDLTGVDANAEALVESLLAVAHQSESPDFVKAREGSAVNGITSPTTSRRGVGALVSGDRKDSDWSTSTARPDKV